MASTLASQTTDPAKPYDAPELRTLLTPSQRRDLLSLISACMEEMRSSIEAGFSVPTEPLPDAVYRAKMEKDGERPVEALERRNSAQEAEMGKLEAECLRGFGEWMGAVRARVGEVVGRQPGEGGLVLRPGRETKPAPTDAAPPDAFGDLIDFGGSSTPLAKKAELLETIYTPIPTALSTLPIETRTTILSTTLLLLLSLSNYSAYSRILLLRLTTSLSIPQSTFTTLETETATSLLLASKRLTAAREAEARAQANASSRRWKVGLASVAGAALIGVTGGLAAPLVAAGIGTVFGAVGLGSTVVAGLVGALAGSGVVVGSLFGAYGGSMMGGLVDTYAREVQDFGFVQLVRRKKSEVGNQETEEEEEAKRRRLKVTIGVSGWLEEKPDVVAPWRVLGGDTEVFALRYELKALLGLGTGLNSMVTSAAWGYVKLEILKRTVLATLWAAVWPIYLLQMAHLVDNPFSIAVARSEKAGKVLADALINKAQGERPVTLIGYSLGARVIWTCLQELATRRAFELIDSVVFIGAPVPSTPDEWRKVRSVVSGRVVNVYSTNDLVLGFLYRTSKVQYGVAGLQKIYGVKGVESWDGSEVVSGHLRYKFLVGRVLKEIGWEGLRMGEVRKGEERVVVIEKEEEVRMKAGAKMEEVKREKSVKRAGVEIETVERTGTTEVPTGIRMENKSVGNEATQGIQLEQRHQTGEDAKDPFFGIQTIERTATKKVPQRNIQFSPNHQDSQPTNDPFSFLALGVTDPLGAASSQSSRNIQTSTTVSQATRAQIQPTGLKSTSDDPFASLQMPDALRSVNPQRPRNIQGGRKPEETGPLTPSRPSPNTQSRRQPNEDLLGLGDPLGAIPPKPTTTIAPPTDWNWDAEERPNVKEVVKSSHLAEARDRQTSLSSLQSTSPSPTPPAPSPSPKEGHPQQYAGVKMKIVDHKTEVGVKEVTHGICVSGGRTGEGEEEEDSEGELKMLAPEPVDAEWGGGGFAEGFEEMEKRLKEGR